MLHMLNKPRNYFMNDWILSTHSSESTKHTLVTDGGGLGLFGVCVHSWPIFCEGIVNISCWLIIPQFKNTSKLFQKNPNMGG